MEFLVDALKSEDYLLFIGILLMSIVINFSKFMDFIDARRKKRVELLTEAITDQHVSNGLTEHFKEELDIEYFRLVHRVKVSKAMLNALLVIRERVGSEVSFRHVLHINKIALNTENLNSLSFRVQLTWFDRIFGCYNLFFGMGFILVGLVAFGIAVSQFPQELNVDILLMGLAAFPVGVYIFNEGIVLISARYVNDALKKYEARNSDNAETQ